MADFKLVDLWNQRLGRSHSGILFYARAYDWLGRRMPLLSYNVAYNLTSNASAATTTISNVIIYSGIAAHIGSLGGLLGDVGGTIEAAPNSRFRVVAYANEGAGIKKTYDSFPSSTAFTTPRQIFGDGSASSHHALQTIQTIPGTFEIPHSSYDGTLEDVCLCFYFDAVFDVGRVVPISPFSTDWKTFEHRKNNHPSYSGSDLTHYFVWHINPKNRNPARPPSLTYSGWDITDYQSQIQVGRYANNLLEDFSESLKPQITYATVSNITRNSFQINWARTPSPPSNPSLKVVEEAQIKLAERGTTFIAGSSSGWMPLRTESSGSGSTNISSLTSGSFTVSKTAQPSLTKALNNWTDYSLTLRFVGSSGLKDSLRYVNSITNQSLQTQWGASILPIGPKVPMISNTSIRPSISFTIDTSVVPYDPAMIKRIRMWVTQFGSSTPIGNQIDVSNSNWASKFSTNTIGGISNYTFNPGTTISWPSSSIGTGQYQFHAQIETGEYDRIGLTRPLNPQNGSENWNTMTPARFMASTAADIRVRISNTGDIKKDWFTGNPIFIDTACQYAPSFALIQRWSHSSAFTTSFKGWVSYPSSGSGTAILRTQLFHLSNSHSIVFGFQTASNQKFTCRVFDMNGKEYFYPTISNGTTPRLLTGTQTDYRVINEWGANIYYIIFEHVGGTVSEAGRVAITKLRVGKFSASAPYLPEAGGTLISPAFNAPANGKLVITGIRRTGLGRTVVTYGDKTKPYYNVEASTVDVDRPNYKWVSSDSEITETITFKRAGLYRLVECCGNWPETRDLNARVTCNNVMVLNGSTIIPMSPWWNIKDSFYRSLINPGASISGTTPISEDPKQVTRVEVYGNGRPTGSSGVGWVASGSPGES